MKLLSIIPLALSIMMMSCPQSHKTNVFNDEINPVLSQPDSVLCYQIEPVQGTDGIQPIPGFSRLEQKEVLSVEKEAILRFVLIDNPENYQQEDDVIVMSPFLPLHEFAFMKGDKMVSILVSTSDMTWVIARGGEMIAKYNYKDPGVVERFCNTFYSF